MAGRMNKLKSKRYVRTTDQSADKTSEEDDISLLRKPFKTNLTNLPKLIKLYQNTTDEVRRYLRYENDILHECRVCRSIFRSVSNFILHKQSYCIEQYSCVPTNSPDEYEDECETIIEKTSEKDKKVIDPDKPKKTLNTVLERIAQKKLIDIENQKSIINEINCKTTATDKPDRNIILQPIQGSSVVFQTLARETKIDEMKNEVMELHSMLNGGSAILGPDGKIFDVNQKTLNYLRSFTNEESVGVEMNFLTCEECNIKFATRKTYLSHMKYKHNESRIVFPCPDCSDTFANAWSVYRHLINVHRKTIPQVRKLRSQVQSKAFRKDQAPMKRVTELAKLTKNLNEQEKIDEENQAWIDNFEGDNDIQMCGGCGRRFERRAALNSHSQMCQKRIALRNTMTLNKLKRSAVAEDKLDKKVMKLENADFKGFDKRKQAVTRRKKAGIQIRCDYTKSQEKLKTDEPEKVENKTEDVEDKEENCELKMSVEEDSQPPAPVPDNVTSNTEALYTIIGISHNQNEENSRPNSPVQDVDVHTEDVIFISNNDISPHKDHEEDPLCLKDIQNDSDSEIEEIMSTPIINSEKSIIEEKIVPTLAEDIQNPVDVINSNTMKMIQLINPTDQKKNLEYWMERYSEINTLQCLSCQQKFHSLSKLKCHMALHFNWMRYRCGICSFLSYDKVTLQNHAIETHDLQEWDKIEATISHIPEWETLMNSWTELREIETSNTMELNNECLSVVFISDKEDEDAKGYTPIDNCMETVVIKPKTRGRPKKTKRHVTKKEKETEIEHKENDKSFGSTESDETLESKCTSRSDSSRSDCSNIQDPVVRKMVYEVIFGENSNTTVDISKIKELEPKEEYMDTTEVTTNHTRSSRNRKNHLHKDFVYDMREFKEVSKSVMSNKAVDVDEAVRFESRKVVKQYSRKPGPRCKTYDLEQKNDSTVYFVDPSDEMNMVAIETVTLTNCDDGLQSDSDSDIYIIESEDTQIIGS